VLSKGLLFDSDLLQGSFDGVMPVLIFLNPQMSKPDLDAWNIGD
jgi:hypothetical protein